MKRLLAILAILVVFMLAASCGDGERVFFDGDISLNARYTLSDTEYTVTYERSGDSERLCVLSPESIAGLTAVKRNNEVTVTLGDLTLPTVADGMFYPFMLFCKATAKRDGKDSSAFIAEDSGTVIYVDDGGTPVRVCGDVLGTHYDVSVLEFCTERRMQNE